MSHAWQKQSESYLRNLRIEAEVLERKIALCCLAPFSIKTQSAAAAWAESLAQVQIAAARIECVLLDLSADDVASCEAIKSLLAIGDKTYSIEKGCLL